jgi:hypothetical protein
MIVRNYEQVDAEETAEAAGVTVAWSLGGSRVPLIS